MRRTLLFLTILFFLFALTSPHRFAYAAAPQTDPLTAVATVLESAVQSLTPPPLPSAPPPTEMTTRSAPKDVSGAQVASAIASAARNATNATIGAVQSASRTLSHSLSQAASAWSAWVYLANSDLISPVKIAAVPSTAAIIVSQTGANVPPKFAILSPSALPTPHLFPLAGASSKQSNSILPPAPVGAVLGTSTQVSYVTQDELTAQLAEAVIALRSLIYQNESAPGSLPATGGYTNDIALSNRIDNLSGSSNGPLTISDATFNNVSGLTAAEIPALNYFPASSTISVAYGGTGTSTAPGANRLLLSDANGNWEYVATSSLGITGGSPGADRRTARETRQAPPHTPRKITALFSARTVHIHLLSPDRHKESSNAIKDQGYAARRFIMARAGDEFKPGDKVPNSGIYRVVHDPAHSALHEVTCVFGTSFPPCRSCPHPRFVLMHAAIHIGTHDHFKDT